MPLSTQTSFSAPTTISVGNPPRFEDYNSLRTNEIFLDNQSFKKQTIGSFSRALNLGSGDQNITGIGFSAALIKLFATVSEGTLDSNSDGWSDGTNNFNIGMDDVARGTNSTNRAISLYTDRAVGASAHATISIGATAFDVKWTITSTPTATAFVTYIAYGR